MMADHRPELPVAPPRAGNWQLSPENTPINGNQEGNHEAISDLKALALSRLQKIRGNKEGNQQATGELPTMQLCPPVEATEVATPEEGSGRLDWLEWIDTELPLLREDREYVYARLFTLPPGGMEAVARRYVRRWQEAAAAEPKPHRKENAGRRAANQSLLYLIKPGSWCGC